MENENKIVEKYKIDGFLYRFLDKSLPLTTLGF